MQQLIIDLDHTLLDTTAFKLDLAKSLGLTSNEWADSYNRYVQDNNVFDARDFLQGVDTSDQKKFYQVISQISKYLYPDSTQFLKQTLKDGWEVLILTFGSESWQEMKIDNMNFPNGVKTLAVSKEKISVVKNYVKEQTVFIDDRSIEIDAVKKSFPEIKAYWMRRENGKYRDIQPTLHDKIISNLNIEL
ncbi:MAG: hypothetical protein Q8P90_02090 [bacterium]|nr:hypothetical protein [bacterium]